MNILGIGTDIVECVRIRAMIERHGEHFLQRVYTDSEISYCQSKKFATEHFAGRWAAKEAIFKCFGTGWRKGMLWTEMEIRHDQFGKPSVHVGGTVKEFMQEQAIADVLITISHCRTYATAFAIALRKEGTNPTG
jgi:holo-[acyl-carrier protein] synthase